MELFQRTLLIKATDRWRLIKLLLYTDSVFDHAAAHVSAAVVLLAYDELRGFQLVSFM